MNRNKHNMLVYKVAQALSGILASTVFKRKFLRNEIKNIDGAAVVIGNHQAALDFTTMIGATSRHITFVVSDSFFNTLPFKKPMELIGVIPKQQFQTSIKEITKMRSAINDNEILMLYPAGLMSEDGLSTPFPSSTYKFLQWLNADIYAARTSGTYFCTPKWSSKIRPGRTYMDIHKIIDKAELANISPEEIQARVDEALMFDAYREQEKHMVKYAGGDNVAGLENVLYICPHCHKEFSIKVKNKNTLYCTECGFAHTSDKYGFLHNSSGVGDEIRYVSDWSRMVSKQIDDLIERGELTELSADATIQTILHEKRKYVNVGRAKITLTPEKFIIDGVINGEKALIEVPTTFFASIPFKPGRQIEIQHNKCTYRCVLDDGKLAMKFVNMVEKFYRMNDK